MSFKLLRYHYNIEILIIAYGIILLIPFLILSFFCNPVADDFVYTNIAREAGFFETQKIIYNGWSGRYITTILLSINPLVFDYLYGYKLMPYLIIIFMLFSIGYFVFINFEWFSTIKKLLFVLIIFSLYVYQIPSPYDAFYWLSSSINYTVPNSLMLIVITNYIKTRNSNIIKMIWLLFLCFVLAGFNELNILIIIGVVLIHTLYNLFVNKLLEIKSILTIVISITGLSISIFATGTFNRIATYSAKLDLFETILISFQTLNAYLFDWWLLKSPILLLSLLYVIYISQLKNKIDTKWLKIHPLLSIFSLYILLFGCFFTSIYATASVPPSRVINIPYFVFIIGWFISLHIAANYFQQKLGKIKIPQILKYLCVLIIATMFILPPSRYRSAISDLVYKTAYNQNKEILIRVKYIKANINKQLTVPELKIKKTAIFQFEDITSDPKYWINQAWADYFNISDIKTSRTKAK